MLLRRYTGLTSSEDGTVRVWDTWNVVQKTVIKPTLPKPGRVPVSMARYNHDGHLIVAGLNNGTIQCWDVRGEATFMHPVCRLCRSALESDSSVASCEAMKPVLAMPF